MLCATKEHISKPDFFPKPIVVFDFFTLTSLTIVIVFE